MRKRAWSLKNSKKPVEAHLNAWKIAEGRGNETKREVTDLSAEKLSVTCGSALKLEGAREIVKKNEPTHEETQEIAGMRPETH